MAALHNGLVHDDGQRQTWGTIHSGLGAGLQQPIDLDANERKPLRFSRRGDPDGRSEDARALILDS
jgi:hypothetical protein